MTPQRERVVWIGAGIVALVGGTGIAALVIWLFFIPTGFPADLTYDQNVTDGSLHWTLEIPPTTWRKIAGKAEPGSAAAGPATQRQVIKLVAQGFDQWGMSVSRCFMTDVYPEADGSARYTGKCGWGGRADERRL
jgi:hypothetical protein